MNSEDLIKLHEGCKLDMYFDTQGVLTIGYGRNLEWPISQAIADLMFEEDMSKVKAQASTLDWYSQMDEVRQAVIDNMIFQLGFHGFMGFKKTIEYLKNMNYAQAALEMLDSIWYRQTPKRAKTLSYMMEDGEWP